MSQLHRCEQAVHRAYRAVDSVSSAPVRERLHGVVRRMDAELPNVRALAELARGFNARPSSDESVAGRTRRQLDKAAHGFAAITEDVLETVVELVEEPDSDKVGQRVAALRQRFPVTCSMSEIVGISLAV